MPVGELQRLILQTDIALERYLLDGDYDSLQNYRHRTQQVDEWFARLSEDEGALKEYRKDIARANSSWQRTQAMGRQLITNKQENIPVSLKEISRFEQQQMKSSQMLGRLYEMFESAIHSHYQDARRDRRQIQVLLLLVFFIAVTVAVFIGNRLANQVLGPLEKLRHGTERFGQGDLGYRIPVEKKDEFGKLAISFNQMADEVEFLAAYDSLTGLLNRREFDNRLNEEVRRANRARHPFVLLLMDLDYFKQINDSHGHQAGDHVLRVLSALLKKQVREVDYVGRTGGEEFGILLTDTSEQDGRETAERIRQVVENKQFTVKESQPINVTMSIGLACYPDDGTNADMLISCADEVLYRAKEKGRNRVECFSDSE
jgi:diguanylate cyclase (GGDEF)-like protein